MFGRVDDRTWVCIAIDRAIDDVDRAIARVRHAQEVDWVSVFASRFREELYQAIQDLARFREALEEARTARS